MPFLKWTDEELGVQIEAMDHEHQALIDAMNQIFDLNAAGADRRAIKDAIDHLVRLTNQHFRNEEYYLETIGYPEFANHRRLHDRLLNRLDDYIGEFDRGSGTVSENFFRFLKIWLTSHIQSSDRDYAAYALTHKVKPN